MIDTRILDAAALDALFRDARTQNDWTEQPVSPGLLREAYDLAKMGPTSANCQPMRVVFLTNDSAKANLLAALSEGNVAKARQAPVAAIFAMDMKFHKRLIPFAQVLTTSSLSK